MFMDRLRRAKDQAEFDQFMSERNGGGYSGDANDSGYGPDRPNGKPSRPDPRQLTAERAALSPAPSDSQGPVPHRPGLFFGRP